MSGSKPPWEVSPISPTMVVRSNGEGRYQNVATCNAADRERAMADAVKIAAVHDLLEALRKAQDKFREYEGLHRAKGTTEGDEKAEINKAMADLCEAAIGKSEGAG